MEKIIPKFIPIRSLKKIFFDCLKWLFAFFQLFVDNYSTAHISDSIYWAFCSSHLGFALVDLICCKFNLIANKLLRYFLLNKMQALLKASRRLDSVRIAIAFPDNLPTLLRAVDCLPTLSLLGSHLRRLHTAAQSVVKSRGGKPFILYHANKLIALHGFVPNK